MVNKFGERKKLASKKGASPKAKAAMGPFKVRAGRRTPVASIQRPSPVTLLREKLEMSQPVFARLLSVSVRTLVTLDSGKPAQDAVSRRLTELVRLTDAVSEVIKQESIGDWLRQPNEAFGGLKPLEVIERGEVDRIWAMIYFLRSGVPS